MKIKSEFDAIQWHKDGDHPDVRLAGPRYCWSAGRALYYIEGLARRANGHQGCSFWLSTKITTEPTEEEKKGGGFGPWWLEIEKKDGERYWRKGYDFSMWSIKSEESAKRGSGVKVPRFDLEAPFMEASSDDFIDYLVAMGHIGGRPAAPEDFTSYGWYAPDLEAVKADDPKGDVNGRLVVYPGDWLITRGDGRVEIVSKADFQKRYPDAALETAAA